MGERVMPTRHRQLLLSSTCIAALLLVADAANAQSKLIQVRPGETMPRGSGVANTIGGQIAVPPSGLPRPGRNTTNVLVRIPRGGYPEAMQPRAPNAPDAVPLSHFLAETPASLECVYESGLGSTDSGKGCNPNLVSATVTGGSKAIGIADVGNYPAAASDLSHYDSEFGLPSADLTIIYANTSTNSGGNTCNTGGTAPPSTSTGWTLETGLDIEMAHAMAPSAHVYLVLANSPSNTDLYLAVKVAATCVHNAGGGEVSMSFGYQFEFSSETNWDSVFTESDVTYLASAGDSTGTYYPCTSPNVVCVGGTTISRDFNGTFQSEGVWGSPDTIVDYEEYSITPLGTGGGVSLYEARPAYQNFLSSVVGSGRGTPDVAAIADPVSPVWIYHTPDGGSPSWYTVGGTSVAAPLFAGIMNRAGFFYGSSYNALANNIYPLGDSGGISSYATNVTQGLCGPAQALAEAYGLSSPYPSAENPPYAPLTQQNVSGKNWNMCTGWGSPKDSGNPNWMRGPSASR
jgi:kumamolisin